MMAMSVQKNKSRAISKYVDHVLIDIDEQTVRIVHGKEGGGQMIVHRILQKTFDQDTDDQIRKYISQFYEQEKIKSKKVDLVLSTKSLITKNVDIPSNNDEEIRKIIDLQAGRYTPYSRDEIVIDCITMESPEEHYTNVLLFIVSRRVVKRYSDILDSGGFEINSIRVGTEGMAGVYDQAAGAETESGAVGGICFSRTSSDFLIMTKHRQVFVRSIPVGIEQFQSDREVATKEFVSELGKSLGAYQDQGVGQALKLLYLAGGSESVLESVQTALRDSIPYLQDNNSKIQILKGEEVFSLDDTAKQDLSALGGVTYFDLVSTLQFHNQLLIDLTPKEAKMRRTFRESGKDIITFGVLVMTIFLMLSVFLMLKGHIKKENLKKLEVLHESSFEEARKLETKSTKSRTIRDLIRKRGRGLYVFEKINSMIGDDIYLSLFSYDKEGAINFSGTANTMSRIFAFVTELEESNFFVDVQTNETKSRREGQREVADFEIECQLAEGI